MSTDGPWTNLEVQSAHADQLTAALHTAHGVTGGDSPGLVASTYPGRTVANWCGNLQPRHRSEVIDYLGTLETDVDVYVASVSADEPAFATFYRSDETAARPVQPMLDDCTLLVSSDFLTEYETLVLDTGAPINRREIESLFSPPAWSRRTARPVARCTDCGTWEASENLESGGRCFNCETTKNAVPTVLEGGSTVSVSLDGATLRVVRTVETDPHGEPSRVGTVDYLAEIADGRRWFLSVGYDVEVIADHGWTWSTVEGLSGIDVGGDTSDHATEYLAEIDRDMADTVTHDARHELGDSVADALRALIDDLPRPSTVLRSTDTASTVLR